MGTANKASKPTVFYLTGSPVFDASGCRVVGKDSTAKGESKGEELLHLISYQLIKNKYCDHGPIHFKDRPDFPTYCNSIAVDPVTGMLYALARFPDGLTDLFCLPIPHRL